MGALGIKRNRSIDSLWEVNEKTIMALESTLGVVIGSDDGRVLYIQDTGVKEVGRGYIDRATKKVHICKERTEDVINTSAKFADHSIQSIYNKLENLNKTERYAINITKREKHSVYVKDIMDTYFYDFKFLCLTIHVSGTSAKFTSGFISRTAFNGIVVPVKKAFGGVADTQSFTDIAATSAVKYFNNYIYVDTLGYPEAYDPAVIVIEGRN